MCNNILGMLKAVAIKYTVLLLSLCTDEVCVIQGCSFFKR